MNINCSKNKKNDRNIPNDVIRYFNLENNGLNLEDENIKKISEIIKSITSKLEIKQNKKK